jgi:hypothetical protein
MKKLILLLVLNLLVFDLSTAQIKKPIINSKVKKVNLGVKINTIENLSTTALIAKSIPIINIKEKQGNGKPLTSWKITPNKPKDTWLSVQGFYGKLTADWWQIESSPFFDGPQISYWNAGWLNLNFRQSKNVEYRLKIKVLVSGWQNKSLLVYVGQIAGRYPVNSDYTVNVVWTATSTSDPRISIGHLLPNDYEVDDYPRGLPNTAIAQVIIDKI